MIVVILSWQGSLFDLTLTDKCNSHFPNITMVLITYKIMKNLLKI